MLQPDTRAAITTVIGRAEAAAHELGWDGEPVLFGLFDHRGPDGPTLELDHGLAGPGLWQAPDPHRPGNTLPVTTVLHRYAHDLTAVAARPWLRDFVHQHGRHLVGVALLFEGWAGWAPPDTYRHGDLARLPARLRREARLVAATDIDGGLHRVLRYRDTALPTVSYWPRIPPRLRQRRVVTGLRALLERTRAV